MQQGMQMDATCNIQQCWELLAEIMFDLFKLGATTRNNIQQHATGYANGRNM